MEGSGHGQFAMGNATLRRPENGFAEATVTATYWSVPGRPVRLCGSPPAVTDLRVEAVKTETHRDQNDTMKKLLALFATLLLAGSAFAAEFPDITISEVKELALSKKAVIIDVNGTESYAKGHVPGALDFDVIENNFAKALPADKNTLIIAYCGGPQCKAYQEAAKAAAKLGYKNVRHMSAGISGWNKAGAPTEAAK